MWGRRVGRDKGTEQREVERGGGGLLSNHSRFREVAGPFLRVPLREDFIKELLTCPRWLVVS